MIVLMNMTILMNTILLFMHKMELQHDHIDDFPVDYTGQQKKIKLPGFFKLIQTNSVPLNPNMLSVSPYQVNFLN